MIHLDTQISDRIPQAVNTQVSPSVGRRLENLRASTAALRTERVATGEVAMRMLDGTDAASLRRLAQRDSAETPTGRLLAAERDGSLIAVISLDDGSVIADPFSETAGAVELLRLRASQLSDERPRRFRRFRLPHLPRARGAIAGSPPGGGSHLLRL